MSNKRISQLTDGTSFQAGDEAVINRGGVNYKVDPTVFTEITEDGYAVVSQADIGTDPNQVPLNQYLGSMAYQDLEDVVVGELTADGLAVDTDTLYVDAANDRVGIGTSSPDGRLTIAIPDYTSSAIGGMIRFQNPNSTADSCVQSFYVSGQGSDVFIGANAYIDTAGTVARFKLSEEASAINIGRSGYITFLTGGSGGIPTERARIDSSGNLLVGTTTSPSDTGTVVADGIYLGGTVAANLLDDYEEGTFTPTLTPTTSGSITLNSSFNTLSYIKIGRAVSIVGRVRVSSVSSPVGQYVELSLPFAIPVGSEDETRVTGTVVVQEAAQDIDKYCLHPKNNTSYIEIGRTDNFTSNAANDFSGNELVAINLTYIIA